MPVSQESPPLPLPGKQLARITIDEYLQMTATGALREGSPIELLDGMLVWKDRRDREGSLMIVGVRHANCVVRLHQWLARGCEGHGCHARSQQPVALSPVSMPEPDVDVVRGGPDDYSAAHPLAADVLLIVEVADGSLQQDRGDKLRMYAAAGIPAYWVVNLLDNHVEVYTQPDPAGRTYATSRICPRGASISFAFPDGAQSSIDVAQLIP